MQAVHLAYTEAQNSSQEPELISATCTFHKMEHITHDHMITDEILQFNAC